MIKLADALDTSIDYLLTGNLQEDSPLQSILFFKLFKAIDKLSEEDQQTVMKVIDAIIAKNGAEQEGLWRIRHSISEVQKFEGVSLKHDVSVPLGKIGDFIEAAETAVLKVMPDARIVAFGHIGDGNVHFNIGQPKSWEGDSFRDKAAGLSNVVYEVVASLQGSISAEHGIGQLKRELLKQYCGEEELAVMKSIKAALDPGNILNPGKVL